MSLAIQSLLKMKLFGDHLVGTRPLQHRLQEWQELVRGKERAVRLICKTMLGVPSAHQGEQEQQMWCFQVPDGGLLVIYLHKGNGAVQFAAKNEAESKDLTATFDFIYSEMATRLRAL